MASSRSRGRPRKENIIQKHDLDGINVSATCRPRGRPRKKPEIEKSTTPRPRGRPRKRPASSSDEEFSPTSPQGRPERLLQSAVDLNGLNDVSLQNLTRSPVRSTRTCSDDDRLSSLRKSRGRPRKHSIPGIINVNEKEAAPPLGNNGIKSTVNFVVPSCVDSGKNSVDLPVISAECKEDLIQPKRRGRPRKKPILSLNNSVSSANELGNDATTLPNPSEHGTNGDTSHLFAENEILKTRDNVPSLSESQNNSLSLPVLPALNCKEEPIQPKRRGRPRKKQVQSLNNFSSSLDVLGNDTTVLPNSGRLGISDGKEKLLCSNNENLKTGDNVLSLSVESQNNLVDVKCKEELIQPRGRGRPRKEVLNLPVSVHVSSALPGKDTDDNISKGQTGSESVWSKPCILLVVMKLAILVFSKKEEANKRRKVWTERRKKQTKGEKKETIGGEDEEANRRRREKAKRGGAIREVVVEEEEGGGLSRLEQESKDGEGGCWCEREAVIKWGRERREEKGAGGWCWGAAKKEKGVCDGWRGEEEERN
ncbi:hypothetical protein BHE74_00005244, partial [Ensete ventricosum]